MNSDNFPMDAGWTGVLSPELLISIYGVRKRSEISGGDVGENFRVFAQCSSVLRDSPIYLGLILKELRVFDI